MRRVPVSQDNLFELQGTPPPKLESKFIAGDSIFSTQTENSLPTLPSIKKLYAKKF